MTPRKTKILLILAIISILLFGALFWTMTGTENNKQGIVTNNNGITTNNNKLQGITITSGTITTTTGDLPSATGDLVILMPNRFYNDGFLQLAKKIKTDYNITVHYKAINDIQYYHKIIKAEENIENVDLYLLPSDRLMEHKGKKITLAEDITPFTHTVFNSYNQEEKTFIPYAIDPLVVLVPNSTSIDDNQELTWKDIASYIINQGQKNKIRMPILRGLDRNDERLLTNGGESFPNHFIITYQIIKQIYQGENINDYQIITDTINNTNLSKRSYANFKITVNTLEEKNKYCATFPDICIISYNYGDIKFGFLSDLAIQKKYFGGGSTKITTLDVYNFPISTGNYPVRGRGFTADKETTNDQAIKIFLNEYLRAGAQNELPLRNEVLSAFNNILDIQKIQKIYGPLFQFENKFSLIYPTTKLQENFLNNTNFVSMIKEKNSPEEFFQSTNWQW